MSCYVDPLFVLESRNPQAFRVGEKHGHQWCHLWADTLEELHAMAGAVGMHRAWFQNHTKLPHYDLVPPRRALAIRRGAIEFSLAAWMKGERPLRAEQQGFFDAYFQETRPVEDIRRAIEQGRTP